MAKQYETVIGLEVHVELATKTKIFCGCSTEFGGAPNTHTCPVCTGMPGSLPVLNKQVVEYAMAIGLALNCEITRLCKFDRKNYFYPDNPQNYQISQLYLPIARNGCIEIESGSGKKKVRIHEMHMEEDADDAGEDAEATVTDAEAPVERTISRRISSKQRKLSLEEYRTTYLQVPKITDHKPVFLSGEVRDSLDKIVRRIGGKGLGVSGLVENLARQHLIAYGNDIDQWRKL